MPQGEQWYTNKDLYEMIDTLKDELEKTRSHVSKYNHLVERVETLTELQEKQIKRCNDVQSKKQGQKSIYENILKLWPIIISTIIFILSLTGKF